MFSSFLLSFFSCRDRHKNIPAHLQCDRHFFKRWARAHQIMRNIFHSSNCMNYLVHTKWCTRNAERDIVFAEQIHIKISKFIKMNDKESSRLEKSSHVVKTVRELAVDIFVYCTEMIRNIILLFVCWSCGWRQMPHSENIEIFCVSPLKWMRRSRQHITFTISISIWWLM